MAHHVDEVHGDHAGLAALLSVAADATEVVAVAHSHADHAGLPGALDGEFCGLDPTT